MQVVDKIKRYVCAFDFRQSFHINWN